MRTIEEKIDELDGFEDVHPKVQRIPPGMIGMTCNGKRVEFTLQAWKTLGEPKYVKAKVNMAKRKLLVQKTDFLDPCGMAVTESRKRHEVGNKMFVQAVEQLTRYDLGIVIINVIGEKSKTMKDAVIYDCSNVRTKKREKKNG